MISHGRKSIRLKDFDYSHPGEYFVTICTKQRMSILGEIVNGAMRLSDTGKIVDDCWRKIPDHFPNARVDIYQIMPNHVHGIVEIRGQMKQDWVTIWQRNYYDHIIRSDIEHFFIERYISLNPFLWHLDSGNPHVHASPIDNLKGTLKEAHGLDESAITYLVDCEMNYRNWQELDMKKQEIRNDIGTIK